MRSPLIRFPTAAADRVDVCCESARAHEDAGEFEQACEILASLWRGPGTRPDITGLDNGAAGELLLRAGSLTAWLGSKRQVEGWQEKAKDLLSEAAARFEAARDLTGWGWAQKSIALCYWREGGLPEARAIVNAALDRIASQPSPSASLPKGEGEHHLWISLQLILGMVEVLEGLSSEALHRYADMSATVEAHGTDLLKALHHNGLENARENLGDIGGAIVEATAAIYYFEQGRHSSRQVLAVNNLANLYRKAGSFIEAHVEVDRAERISRLASDDLHLGHLQDTRALIYLEEEKFIEAEHAAAQSVAIFERGDEHELLVRSLVTLARARARRQTPDGRPQDSALATYVRAYELAGTWLGSKRAGEIALEMISELAGEACLESHVTLDDAHHAFEGSIIRRALAETGGNITAAGLRLGESQQALSFILRTRHKELQPPKRRMGKKSIMRSQ